MSEVINAIREYLFPYEKIQKKFKQIKNIEDLKIFIKERSAFVTQTTLYGYLKTRMGLKYTLMFSDEAFLGSINKSKWNIFAVAVSDLTFFTISFIKNSKNIEVPDLEKFYKDILEKEINNGMPTELLEKYLDIFKNKIESVNLHNYYKEEPFKSSGNALYEWSPIADELKTLDKEIVLNSIKNKWNLVIKDFENLIKNYN